MAPTYKHIQSITASGSSGTMEFTSIPQTYTDLVLHITSRSSYAAIADDAWLFFNGSTSDRTTIFVYGSGSSASSLTSGIANDGFFTTSDTATANVFSSSTIYIPDYTSSKIKSFSTDTVDENNATTTYQALLSGLWSNTAAITSIQIVTAGGRGVWKQYSTASLYGIKNS